MVVVEAFDSGGSDGYVGGKGANGRYGGGRDDDGQW